MSATRIDKWNKVVAAIKEDVAGFEVLFKDESKFHRLLGWLSFWGWKREEPDGKRVYEYMQMTTTLGNKIWFPSEEYVKRYFPSETLQHEWVHMKDAQTFFGLLSFLPASINRILFSASYLLILPWPGFIRAYAEIRAYRRTLELTRAEARTEIRGKIVEYFTGPTYFYMWPFKSHVENLLQAPSPYKELMDEATQ